MVILSTTHRRHCLHAFSCSGVARGGCGRDCSRAACGASDDDDDDDEEPDDDDDEDEDDDTADKRDDSPDSDDNDDKDDSDDIGDNNDTGGSTSSCPSQGWHPIRIPRCSENRHRGLEYVLVGSPALVGLVGRDRTRSHRLFVPPGFDVTSFAKVST